MNKSRSHHHRAAATARQIQIARVSSLPWLRFFRSGEAVSVAAAGPPKEDNRQKQTALLRPTHNHLTMAINIFPFCIGCLNFPPSRENIDHRRCQQVVVVVVGGGLLGSVVRLCRITPPPRRAARPLCGSVVAACVAAMSVGGGKQGRFGSRLFTGSRRAACLSDREGYRGSEFNDV